MAAIDDLDPFRILGVPHALVAKERRSHADRIRALVDGYFRVLTRLYHPDVGGDPAQFAAFSAARDEVVEDPIAVAQFFVGERVRPTRVTAPTPSAGAPGRLLKCIDSRRVLPWLGSAESVYLASLGASESVIEVAEGERGLRVRSSALLGTPVGSDIRSRNGQWQIRTLESAYDRRLRMLPPSEQRERREARERQRESRLERGDDRGFKDEEARLSRWDPIPWSAGLDVTVVGAIPLEVLVSAGTRRSPSTARGSLGAGPTSSGLQWVPLLQMPGAASVRSAIF